MITFRQYLAEESESEIAKTKRQGIVHFQDMKPVEALQFLRKIKDEMKGKLKDIPVTLKVDGGSLRFGKDKKGEYFLETGNSGPIQSKKAFSTFNRDKGVTSEVIIQRAMHYDDIYDHIEDSKIWETLPNDAKVSCEILYNPMGEEVEDDHLKFVSVKYNAHKLGKLMTLVPITVTVSSTGAAHPDKDKIIDDLLSQSDKDIKIISPKLKPLTLDVEAHLKPLESIGEDAEQILKSLKHADKPLKLEYQVILNAIKARVADAIMQHPIKGRDVIGDEIEGYVVELDGKLYKVTTPKFKQAKKDEKKKDYRNQL
jgi:hypothetical protein